MVPTRKKLWEHDDYQCPILGTCLSMAELRKLARKLDLSLPSGASDYDVHVQFVRLARREGPVAQYLNKYLDRKYRKDIRAFHKIADQTALEALWKLSVKAGDVPGPFWALMSHPGASAPLLARVFGEVHMLSHLMGAANRADLKRLTGLERRVDELGQALSRVQAARRAQKLEWTLRVKALEDSLEEERQERLKFSRQMREAALPVQRPEDDVQALRGQIEALRGETRRQAAIIENLYRENAALREREGELQADLERAEVEIVRALPCAGEGCPAAGQECPGAECAGADCLAQDCQDCPALHGKNVLYVGGRCNLVRHYRQLVERTGCRFHHHDGGVEHSAAELYGKLASADVVLCPVDCVSHEACLAVKKACKHCMKPFLMLRSSGLSALSRSLDTLATAVN